MMGKCAVSLLALSLASQAYAQAYGNTSVVTVEVYQSCGNPSLTKTLFPPIYSSNTSIVAPSTYTYYVTSTTVPPYERTLTARYTSTTIPPSGTKPGTVIIVEPTPGRYVTTTTTPPYDRTLTAPYTATTIEPSGTAPGTVIIVDPPPGRYITRTVPYTGSTPITGPVTVTTIFPSGTLPGTYDVATPGLSSSSAPSATPSLYPPGLPNCSHTCVDYDFGDCSINDPACICANPELVRRYSCCVAEQCDGPDQDDVVDFAANFCAAYGITDLPTNATQGCNPIIYPPGLPNCTHACVNYDFDGCSIDDPACICANPELVQRYSCCVAEQCDGPDQDSVVDTAANFCAAYGITNLPTNATQGCNPIVYPPGLPNCTHTCVNYDFDGCSIDDPACICSNPELVRRYSCCVSESCDGADQNSVVDSAANFCAAYGITNLPTNAAEGCYPSSTPASSVSTTSASSASTTSASSASTTIAPSSTPLPPGYVTSTTYGEYSSRTTITTIPYSGTVSGTVIIGIGITYTTTTTSQPTITPTPAPPGTVYATTYGDYSGTTTLTVIPYSGTVSGTISIGVPITRTTTTTTSSESPTPPSTTPPVVTTTLFFCIFDRIEHLFIVIIKLLVCFIERIVFEFVIELFIKLFIKRIVYFIKRIVYFIKRIFFDESSSTPPAAPTCGFANGQRSLGGSDVYTVQCGSDTTGIRYGNVYTTTAGQLSFEQCYSQCDGISGCQGFVWLGAIGSFGNGAGDCYFKGTGVVGEGIAFDGAFDSSKVAAIKVNQLTVIPPFTTTYHDYHDHVSARYDHHNHHQLIPRYHNDHHNYAPSGHHYYHHDHANPNHYHDYHYSAPRYYHNYHHYAVARYNDDYHNYTTPRYNHDYHDYSLAADNHNHHDYSIAANNHNYHDYTLAANDHYHHDYSFAANNYYHYDKSYDYYEYDKYHYKQYNYKHDYHNYYDRSAYYNDNHYNKSCHYYKHNKHHYEHDKYYYEHDEYYYKHDNKYDNNTNDDKIISTPPPPTYVPPSTTYSTTSVSLPPATPLPCIRQGYLVQNRAWYTVEIASGAITPAGTISWDANVQAIGYNRCDGLIYGTDSVNRIIRFGADLVAQQVLPGNYRTFQTGDVDQNCQYWGLRTAGTNTAAGYWIHIDLNNATSSYGSIIGSGQFTSGGFTGGENPNEPQYFFADWAYVPYAGDDYLWGVGIDQTTKFAYLYRFTKSTLTLDNVFSYGDIGITNDRQGNNRVNFGAVYASADGYLYGAENLSGRMYRFTVTAPYGWQYLGVGSSTTQNDGARCIDNTEAIGTY
ncbi:hypothetical protein HII31_12672 [Pseudocercospora fuligena]|uniref:CFEM domain-containing protein n=1 Tax=Pseudocercospora fuligena TaxID=685502 RepID=A0A8H6R6I1_9PEZI|nr:hypothetical protein HII31_12672 [Pseudocercospora fuligena]